MISIIIATFNAEAHLKDCLDSISRNILSSYELIIVDGGSTDQTLEIAEKASTSPPLIISEPDQGIYDAMNKGIKHAKGKWILFLGADDRILPTFSHIIPELKDEQTLYYGNCVNGAQRFGGKFTPYKLSKMNLCHQAILYPKAAFDKYSYQLRYPVFADYLINIQCWGDRSIKKQYIDIDLTFYNLEGFSSTAQDPEFKKDKPNLVKKYLGYLIYLRYSFRKFKESKKPESRFF